MQARPGKARTADCAWKAGAGIAASSSCGGNRALLGADRARRRSPATGHRFPMSTRVKSGRFRKQHFWRLRPLSLAADCRRMLCRGGTVTPMQGVVFRCKRLHPVQWARNCGLRDRWPPVLTTILFVKRPFPVHLFRYAADLPAAVGRRLP
jgi:hypothetical protein